MTLSLFIKQTKEKRKDRQIWQPLCYPGPEILSVILLATPGKWTMQRRPLSVKKTTRTEILMKYQSESCVDGCDMEWYESARQVLQLNIIKPLHFADAMRDLLASSAM